jgi:phosphate transport system substrate-binding protein
MGIRFWRTAQAALVALAAVAASAPAPAEDITAGGTGSVTELLRLLGAEFQAREGIKLDIVPSMGSGGGVLALKDNVLDIAVSGQALSKEALADGLHVALSLRTPFGWATSQPQKHNMAIADIIEAYRTPGRLWPDGTPVRVILRPKMSPDTLLMEELVPALGPAMEAARQRPDIPVTSTDPDNADVAERTAGSLAGITALQLISERRKLHLISIDGVAPTWENFERGTYKYGKTLHFILPARPKPAAERFIAFLGSPQGQQIYRQAHGH